MQITTTTPWIVPRGGGIQQSSIQGGSALRSNPLPSYEIPFLTEKVPLSYTFPFDKIWYPFYIPSLEVLCIPFYLLIRQFTQGPMIRTIGSASKECVTKSI